MGDQYGYMIKHSTYFFQIQSMKFSWMGSCRINDRCRGAIVIGPSIELVRDEDNIYLNISHFVICSTHFDEQ